MGWPEKRLLQYTEKDTVRSHAWEVAMKRVASKVRQDLVWGGSLGCGGEGEAGVSQPTVNPPNPSSPCDTALNPSSVVGRS